jgi:hypothetical protein
MLSRRGPKLTFDPVQSSCTWAFLIAHVPIHTYAPLVPETRVWRHRLRNAYFTIDGHHRLVPHVRTAMGRGFEWTERLEKRIKTLRFVRIIKIIEIEYTWKYFFVSLNCYSTFSLILLLFGKWISENQQTVHASVYFYLLFRYDGSTSYDYKSSTAVGCWQTSFHIRYMK